MYNVINGINEWEWNRDISEKEQDFKNQHLMTE